MIRQIFCIVLLCLPGFTALVGWGTSSDNADSGFYTTRLVNNYLAYFINKSPFIRQGEIISGEYKDVTKQSVRKSRPLNHASFRRIISNKSMKYRIEPSLVSALITVESNWDHKAVSRRGAKGLMQLMPSTAKDMNVNNPFNPEENIEGGMRYLRYLLDKFDGDIALALAAYNAGPGMIQKYKGMPPITETKEYVERILSIYNNKRLAYNESNPHI